MALKLLLFDDIEKNRKTVAQALKQALGQNGKVQEFEPAVGGKDKGTYEQRLASDLQRPPNDNADLLVVDRDLSAYGRYNGLSEDVVRRVADTMAIPECGYARGERDDNTEWFQRSEQREACIRVSSDEGFASRVVDIAAGFAQIREKLPAAMQNTKKKSAASILASILGKPEYTEKISLYASGDQGRLSSLTRIEGKGIEEQARRLTCLLGYWLWDSVLRFPGVVLNQIAASSYLNIREDAFVRDAAVQSVFQDARYHGPFDAAKGPAWWRGMLDDMIVRGDCNDGRRLASKRLGRDIPRSECYVDRSIPAGFYCVFAHKPVSLANSRGGLSWLPRGADVARISSPKLDELGPWL